MLPSSNLFTIDSLPFNKNTFFQFQFSPDVFLAREVMTVEAGDSGIINMEDEDDDLSDQVKLALRHSE